MKKALLRLAIIFGVAVAIVAVCLTNTGTMLVVSLPIEIAGVLLSFWSWGKLSRIKAEEHWKADRKKNNRLEYREGFRGRDNA